MHYHTCDDCDKWFPCDEIEIDSEVTEGCTVEPPRCPTCEAGAVSDDEMAEAMRRYGGSFVRTLAALLHCADDDNRARILATWPEYCAEYRDMVRLQRKRLEAEAPTGEGRY